MATEILMPKLGLTMTEGLIQKWLVQVGDTVTSGQPLLEISSEKLTSEVESPASGVVLDIVHDEGAVVDLGLDGVESLAASVGASSCAGASWVPTFSPS